MGGPTSLRFATVKMRVEALRSAWGGGRARHVFYGDPYVLLSFVRTLTFMIMKLSSFDCVRE